MPKEIINDGFSYTDLQKNLKNPLLDSIRKTDYSAFINMANKDFFYFQRTNTESSRNTRQADKGLKLHVSLDTHPEGNIEKGWEIVRNILMENDVNYFKIIRPEQLKKSSNYLEDPGREITIYAFRENDCQFDGGKPSTDHVKRFEKIIEEITCKLAEAGVQPAALPKKDTAIEGSNYISWRNDNDRKLVQVEYHISQNIQQPSRSQVPIEESKNIGINPEREKRKRAYAKVGEKLQNYLGNTQNQSSEISKKLKPGESIQAQDKNQDQEKTNAQQQEPTSSARRNRR